MTAVRTTCAYCGVGCGVLASDVNGRSVRIAGDPAHPANAGRLCSKGTHLHETVGLEGRLLHPMIGDRPAEWDAALDLVAARFAETIARHGPDSVAFYVSGQLLTEDYYVANKLMKGFIGSGNIDTNSRLCMASAVAAHVRNLGEDVVPASYADLDEAELIILVGSNTAWCHPVVHQRIMRRCESSDARIVVIDPRATETATGADLHLPLRPGSDVALFQALLAHLYWQDAIDDAVMATLDVPAEFWSRLASIGNPIAYAAARCDLPLVDVARFFEMVRVTPRTVTLFSQGVNQSSRGTDKASAILNLHLATGRFGKPGSTAFSITGQPNAMGGREVGGLATQLAAHMGFSAADVARVARFWRAPQVATAPGLKAVDLFRAVGEGRIKALWIMATNPAVSMPEAHSVREALAACPFVIVSDCMANTDTSAFAHVRLPSAAWGEKDGTVTNSERVISRQRAFLPLPGAARPDWWQMAAVARRMGWEAAFAYETPAEIFREHAALSAFENAGTRLFDLGAWATLDDERYESLEPFQWGGRFPFSDGRFPTASGRASLSLLSDLPPAVAPGAAYPLLLNTGRLRDQWHTMTRTGLAPTLMRHRNEPTVEVHPDDAGAYGLSAGMLATVRTAHGEDVFRVVLSDGQRRGELFVPIHWNLSHSSGGRAGLLVNAAVDPVSGQPEFKHTPAALAAFVPHWHGLLLTAKHPDLPLLDYWTQIRIREGAALEFASNASADDLIAALCPADAASRRMDMEDRARGMRRSLVLQEGRCTSLLYLSRAPLTVARSWLFDNALDSSVPQMALLAGRPGEGMPNPGETVCSCFNVGINTILAAIEARGLESVDAIGSAVQAGTNCGSCRPALARLLCRREMADAA